MNAMKNKYQIIEELKEAGHGISIFHEDPETEHDISPYSCNAGSRRSKVLYLQCKGLTLDQAESYIDSIGSPMQHCPDGDYKEGEYTELEIFNEDVSWFLEGFSQEQIEQIYNGQINFQNIISQSRPYAMG